MVLRGASTTQAQRTTDLNARAPRALRATPRDHRRGGRLAFGPACRKKGSTQLRPPAGSQFSAADPRTRSNLVGLLELQPRHEIAQQISDRSTNEKRPTDRALFRYRFRYAYFFVTTLRVTNYQPRRIFLPSPSRTQSHTSLRRYCPPGPPWTTYSPPQRIDTANSSPRSVCP